MFEREEIGFEDLEHVCIAVKHLLSFGYKIMLKTLNFVLFAFLSLLSLVASFSQMDIVAVVCPTICHGSRVYSRHNPLVGVRHWVSVCCASMNPYRFRTSKLTHFCYMSTLLKAISGIESHAKSGFCCISQAYWTLPRAVSADVSRLGA